ncbi:MULTISPECIES: hypothetical protein [Arthrobacter]|uniref:Uncharacterized protein n=2 Tax=Arthrobacter TaxID=1663 RepID=A0ABU9KQ49_9MICC|nr:hypothetical protein [Arthrobacter sp. YJM1]MDP5228690.1 hypothetical protein [Arthrobacter sp. YJM1]
MSSFIVGTDLIDLLATVARRIRNGKMPDHYFDYEDTATAQSIGQALAHFNHVAVSDSDLEEYDEPEYTFTPVEEILSGPLEPRHLVQIYLAASCYNYQTGEDHPGWAYSLPWATVKAIRFWAATRLYGLEWPIVKLRGSSGHDWAGIEDAAWEWTREHGFPDLPIDSGSLDEDEVRQAISITERMAEQMLEVLGMTRVSLLARLVHARHPDGVYVLLKPVGGRFVSCAVVRESGQVIAEISSPEKTADGTEPADGDELQTLLENLDPGAANPAWTEFAPEDFPSHDDGVRAVDVAKASAWSPQMTRTRPANPEVIGPWTSHSMPWTGAVSV